MDTSWVTVTCCPCLGRDQSSSCSPSFIEFKLAILRPPCMNVRKPGKVAEGMEGRLSKPSPSTEWFLLLQSFSREEYHRVTFLWFWLDVWLTKSDRNVVNETVITAMQASRWNQKSLQTSAKDWRHSEAKPDILITAAMTIQILRHSSEPRPSFWRSSRRAFQSRRTGSATTFRVSLQISLSERDLLTHYIR